MTMQHLERELRRSGGPRDQTFADTVSRILKERGEDIPLPQEGTKTLESSTNATQEGLEVAVRRERRKLTPFGILLDQHLYRRHIRIGEFAKQVGINRAYLSQIMWGHKKGGSIDLILEISDKLELSEGERQTLLDAVPNRRRRPRKGNLR